MFSRWIYFGLFIGLACITLQAQDEHSLHFGDNIRLISIEGETIRYPVLSYSGDYLYANMYLDDYINGTVFPLGINQALWSLNWSGEVELLTYQNMNETNDVAAVFIDNQIAVKTNMEIQLRSIEDFSTINAVNIPSPFMPESLWIPNEYYTYLTKSSTDTELATFGEETFWVWDVDSLETYSIPLPSDVLRTNIIATEVGWLMRFSFSDRVPAFMFCTPLLEECNYGERPYHSALAVSLDGEHIFSGHLGDNIFDSYAVWYRDDDGEYEIQTEYFPNEYPINQGSGLCRLQINASSTYISSLCENKRLEIWDINLTGIQQSVDDVMMRRWLPDGEHFITLSFSSLSLQLYELGNDEPLDEILVSDFSDVEGTIGTGDIDETLIVSESGNVVLLNQGSVALLIPISNENDRE